MTPDIPRYPDCTRPCRSVDDAVSLMIDIGIDLSPQALIYFTGDARSWPWYSRAVFSYNFFNLSGRNVGTYCAPMDTFSFQSGSDGHGRVWGAHLKPFYQSTDISSNIAWVARRNVVVLL